MAQAARPRRRFEDVDELVRQWVRAGSVKPEVARRFLSERRWDAPRRAEVWAADGYPRRRTEDRLAS